MKKFIIIKEEVHGIIGYAPTYIMAIYFLVDNGWLENLTEEKWKNCQIQGLRILIKSMMENLKWKQVKCITDKE